MAEFSIRIPDKLNSTLLTAAQQLDRSKNYIVRKAIEAYIQELQEDIEDYNDAERVLAENNPTYSLEEVLKELKIGKDELDS